MTIENLYSVSNIQCPDMTKAAFVMVFAVIGLSYFGSNMQCSDQIDDPVYLLYLFTRYQKKRLTLELHLHFSLTS